MSLKLVCVGKIKEKFYTDGVNEYVKRLNAFTKFEIIEVKEINTSDILHNMQEEGKLILDKITDDYVVTLEIEGKNLSSTELASFIENNMTYGNSKITFVIGGSNGLSNEVKKRSNYALSFSKMTFPHQLMRVICVEQIYRAFTIINHKEYHK